MTNGIDVSWAQARIDWAKVKASGDVDFSIIRACYGWDNDKQIDSQFRNNVNGCLANSIPFGLFHYSYAWSIKDARCEARWFLKVIAGLKPEYPLFFDFEEAFQIGGAGKEGFSTAKQMDMVDAWMEIVQGAGYFAALYSTGSAIKRLRNAYPDRMGKYAVWVAHVDVDKPMTPGDIWQYSWRGEISGIRDDLPPNHSGKHVDLDYSYRDYPTIIKTAGLNGWDKAQPPKPLDPPSKGAFILDLNALHAQGYDSITIRI